ncbi:hypothetical protein, partial [Pontiella sp.]|uniref:hypothetical protein n=1 Tax=Pontiella sp. TaxID=2837462 RepID=UPI00356870BB
AANADPAPASSAPAKKTCNDPNHAIFDITSPSPDWFDRLAMKHTTPPEQAEFLSLFTSALVFFTRRNALHLQITVRNPRKPFASVLMPARNPTGIRRDASPPIHRTAERSPSSTVSALQTAAIPSRRIEGVDRADFSAPHHFVPNHFVGTTSHAFR